jgi:hypothetical protein
VASPLGIWKLTNSHRPSSSEGTFRVDAPKTNHYLRGGLRLRAPLPKTRSVLDQTWTKTRSSTCFLQLGGLAAHSLRNRECAARARICRAAVAGLAGIWPDENAKQRQTMQTNDAYLGTSGCMLQVVGPGDTLYGSECQVADSGRSRSRRRRCPAPLPGVSGRLSRWAARQPHAGHMPAETRRSRPSIRNVRWFRNVRWYSTQPSSSAPNCPARGHRLKGGPSGPSLTRWLRHP